MSGFHIQKLDRRRFLQLSGLTGSGLLLGVAVIDSDPAHAAANTLAPSAFAPSAFLQISSEGIVIYATQPEIGQGVRTSIPMILAEELDVAWKDVEIRIASIDAKRYGVQTAGGSTATPRSWNPMRRAGAVARAMLIEAAAREWNVSASECRTRDSKVMHAASGRRAHYRDLAEVAATLPVPDADTLQLKTRTEYRLLNTRVRATDGRDLVSGRPTYASDVRIPGMLYAMYVKCPRIGGKVRAANLDAVRSLPGIVDIFVLEGNGDLTELKPGVALLARDTWSALSARRALRIEWDESSAASDDWPSTLAKARELAPAGGDDATGSDLIAERGDVATAFASAKKTLQATYSYAFLSHAQLEPQNCVARPLAGGGMELWPPSQTPQRAQTAVAKLLGVAEANVTIHPQRLGGGFGRRLNNDVACEAAAIAARAQAPIKLQWIREDDMTNDVVRAGGLMALQGALDARGRLTGWRNHQITFSPDGKRIVSGGTLRADEDFAPLLPAVRITRSVLPWSSPCGFWRAPGASAFAFPLQSFLHEMSIAAGRDHLEFLLELLGEPRWLPPANAGALNTARAAGVLRLAAEKAGWGKRLPEGRALGIAFYFSHTAHVAEVAEVSVDAAQHITVHAVTVAVDVGPVVNLNGAEAQCQGSVIDGLSAMAAQQLTHRNGVIDEKNFDRYALRRIGSEPRIDIHFLQSDFPPSGLGEPVLPPVAPAICNAVFSACGQRIRSLPISAEGFSI
ncbi:MAG: xanthine dehydrogenase family protein molybdopterin-binding subunit [Gammaproteobacteria bacterium]|nr:xanthine dehydrogenase family protein molybdopterin-binding subunit [Gammaproteobacteria bacterium]